MRPKTPIKMRTHQFGKNTSLMITNDRYFTPLVFKKTQESSFQRRSSSPNGLFPKLGIKKRPLSANSLLKIEEVHLPSKAGDKKIRLSTKKQEVNPSQRFLTTKKKELYDEFKRQQEADCDSYICSGLKREVLFLEDRSDILLCHLKYLHKFMKQNPQFNDFFDHLYGSIKNSFLDYIQKFSTDEKRKERLQIGVIETKYKDIMKQLKKKTQTAEGKLEVEKQKLIRKEKIITGLKKEIIVLKVCLNDEKDKYGVVQANLRELEKKKKSPIPIAFLESYEENEKQKTDLKTKIKLLEKKYETINDNSEKLKTLKKMLGEKKIQCERLKRENDVQQRQLKKLRRCMSLLKLNANSRVKNKYSGSASPIEIVNEIEGKIAKEENLTPRPKMGKLLGKSSIVCAKVIRHPTTQKKIMSIVKQYDEIFRKKEYLLSNIKVFERLLVRHREVNSSFTSPKWIYLCQCYWNDFVAEEMMKVNIDVKKLYKRRIRNLLMSEKELNLLVDKFWTLKEIDRTVDPFQFFIVFLRKEYKLLPEENGNKKEEKELVKLIFSILSQLEMMSRADLYKKLVLDILLKRIDQNIHYSQKVEIENFVNYVNSFSKKSRITKKLFRTVVRNYHQKKTELNSQFFKELIVAANMDFPFSEVMELEKLLKSSSNLTRRLKIQFLVKRLHYHNSIQNALVECIVRNNKQNEMLSINDVFETLALVDKQKPVHVWEEVIEKVFDIKLDDYQSVNVKKRRFFTNNDIEFDTEILVNEIRKMDLNPSS